MKFKKLNYLIGTVAVSRTIVILLGLATITCIARFLGPELQGEYAYINLSINMLVTIFNFGVPTSLVYFIGRSYNNEEIRIVISNSYLLNFIFFLIGIFLTYVTIYHSSFKIEIKEVLTNYTIFSFVIISFLLKMMFNNTQHIQLGKLQYKKYNYLAMAQAVINIFLVLIAIFLDCLTVEYVILSMIFSLIVVTFISFDSLRFHFADIKIDVACKLFFYGIKSHLNNIISFLMYRTDLVLIGYFMGVKYVGLYSVIILVVENLQVLTTSAATVLFSKTANTTKKDEVGNIQVIYKSCVILGLINFLIAISIFSFSEYIFNLLFGVEYLESIKAFDVLIWVIVFSSFSKIIGSYFAGINKLEYNLYTAVLMFFLNMILNILLISDYGILGASLSTLVVTIVNSIIKFYLINNLRLSVSNEN
ncbi:oligosaccharide flippase family protein [Shewanella algae]|uniref:oligosaccharide flippase family protein n=1 Tax=Shewanella algae TaxID=38313 RepID=UPI001AADA74B|nr:oligosaccharide flippase family protein [Shewanella algae]MBO2653274.1 oligosaccharide flippase family protein [Shewanella algae]